MRLLRKEDDSGNCIDDEGKIVDIEEEDLIRTLTTVSSCLSLVGCSFILLTYYAFPTTRTTATRIVYYLALSNWFVALQFIIGSISNAVSHENFCGGFWCVLTACISQFWGMAALVWAWCIGFNVYIVLDHALKGSDSLFYGASSSVLKLERLYHVGAWGLSSLFLVLGVVTSDIGPAGSWCWFQDDVTQISVFYVPAIFGFCCIVFFYFQTSKMIHDSPLEDRVTGRLRKYLVCYLVVVGFALISRVVDWWTGEPVTVLLAIQAVMYPLQGFLYSLVYATNKRTKQLYIDWWNGFRPSRFEDEGDDEQQQSYDQQQSFDQHHYDDSNMGGGGAPGVRGVL